MLRRSTVAVLMLLVSACAAHEKAGDRAAAVGDWKTAERAYAEAARKEPEKKELQEKHQRARGAALDAASRAAQACAAGQDWECALSESDYALALDPGSVPMATLRREAGRQAGHLRLRRAEEASDRREHAAALALLRSARDASDDPGLGSALRQVQPRIVRGAAAEADRLRAAQQHPQAIELLALAAEIDPAQRGRLEQARGEYERWKDAEAERLALEGDDLLADRRFADAKARYDAAARLRSDGRAQPLARYAGHLAAGDAALQRRDFGAAEKAFSDAAQSGVDDGFAAAELDRVTVRPYAVRLRSVLVRPARPDGWPWAGDRSRALDLVLARLARLPPADAVSAPALDLIRRLPPANQPNLVVTVALPDGRALQAVPRRGAYALLDGTFVVATNAYDDRVISMRVVHEGTGEARPLDLGLVTFRLGDLVAGRGAAAAGAAVTELRVELDVSDLPDGAYSGLTPIPDLGNLSRSWSVPGPGSRGYRLLGLDAAAAPADLARRPAGAAPHLFVEVEQRGQVVYRSAVIDRAAASWKPPAAYLFAEPDEPLVVRLLDQASPRPAVLLAHSVTGRALDRGAVDLASPLGTTLRLRAEPRRAGPGAP